MTKHDLDEIREIVREETRRAQPARLGLYIMVFLILLKSRSH